jgi:hypothetical protein
LTFVYFTDRDLGKRFPKILRSSGLTVERHGDHFAPDTADEVCGRKARLTKRLRPSHGPGPRLSLTPKFERRRQAPCYALLAN